MIYTIFKLQQLATLAILLRLQQQALVQVRAHLVQPVRALAQVLLGLAQAQQLVQLALVLVQAQVVQLV